MKLLHAAGALALAIAAAAPVTAADKFEIAPKGADVHRATQQAQLGPNTMSNQPKIVSDAIAAAQWMSQALASSGYKADFSLGSLKEIDRFFDEHSLSGEARPGGLLSQQLGARIFGVGSYVGEVIRRQNGGTWQGNDNDPPAEMNIAVRLKSGAVMWPVQRVMKRLKNGMDDGIWAYGVAAGER
jgi:hypothetical protein